ncbi:MAG: S-methyl-5-thioribose-1-phosphate isomerase [Calditrichia bacterium]
MIRSLEWIEESQKLRIVDQTAIPAQLLYKDLTTIEDVFEAIQKLRIRGAPAIGVCAAFGLYLGLRKKKFDNKTAFISEAVQLAEYLRRSRPTAINLQWALQLIVTELQKTDAPPEKLLQETLKLARFLQRDDENRCAKIGAFGAEIIPDGATVLTHCNTGALATAGIGTAFGAILTAFQQGKKISVLVDETRPLLQGARLTMWELDKAGIPATLIADNMAAYAMQRGKVDVVIVGADRIAANGDVANKIGTYSLALCAHHHNIPFYVAAPLSTFDFSLSSGKNIPIEERGCREITHIWEKLPITIESARCWNPAFDVTPAQLITGIITEQGIFHQPFENHLKRVNFKHEFYNNQKEQSI